MPLLDLADDSYVSAAPALVAVRLRGPEFWRSCWPDLTLRPYHDRGIEGMRWYVDGALVGTAELWLEPFRDGTLVHAYLRADPAERVRSKPARLAHHYTTGLKRALFALKDDLEGRTDPRLPYTLDVLELRDTSRKAWDDPTAARPVRTYVWRPDTVDPPLVLLSHGTGGHALELAWLAEALVGRGFVAAAVEHHGCNLLDGNLPEGFAFGWERPADLSFVLDSIDGFDEHRTGVAGYSGGAYAAAALLGARLDPDVYRTIASGAVEGPAVPEFPDLIGELRERQPELDVETLLPRATASKADARIRAAFLIAPAMGAMLDAESLTKLDRPVAVRWGDADDNSPPERNGLRYTALIPDADGRSLGPAVGHDEFGGDQPDPTGVRSQVATEVVAFFTEHLTRETLA